MQFPESVTISYRWQASDYEAVAVCLLFKKVGGFFVGCSVECLMASGTVRAHQGVRAPNIAVIEGARYDMKVFRSPNGQHIHTFYPMFLGAADIVDGGSHEEVPTPRGGGGVVVPDVAGSSITPTIRIVAAKVNLPGNDVGLESVTLANVGPVDQVSVNDA